MARRGGSADTAELFYGYGYNRPLDKKEQAKLPQEAKALRNDVGKDWITYETQFDDGCLARKKLPHVLRGKKETIALARGDTIEEEVALALFQIFEKIRPTAEKTNMALRK